SHPSVECWPGGGPSRKTRGGSPTVRPFSARSRVLLQDEALEPHLPGSCFGRALREAMNLMPLGIEEHRRVAGIAPHVGTGPAQNKRWPVLKSLAAGDGDRGAGRQDKPIGEAEDLVPPLADQPPSRQVDGFRAPEIGRAHV